MQAAWNWRVSGGSGEGQRRGEGGAFSESDSLKSDPGKRLWEDNGP